MARERDEEQGVSLSTADGIESGGIFGPGPAKIVKARFAEFEYKKKNQQRGTKAPVLLVVYERDGEEERVPYSVGSGWGISKDGLRLIPRNGQTGLPTNCNAMIYLESMETKGGMPQRYLQTPDQLDGVELTLIAKPIERDFSEDKGGTKKKTLLIVKSVESAPWLDGDDSADEKPAKGKNRGKSDDDDDNNDADEKPTKRGSSKKDDDDDEDEKPKGKSDKGGKGKKDDDDDNDDVEEEAREALIEVLESKSPIRQSEIEAEVRARLKGNPQRNVIAARCSEDDFLNTEKGWSFDEKKGKITLDN